jgi:hypothetical protein
MTLSQAPWRVQQCSRDAKRWKLSINGYTQAQYLALGHVH